MNRRTNAFTLIELLVVIAITVILFGLLFGPLIRGFHLTRQAQTAIEAQATARLVMDQLSREVANAVFVFDNTSPDASVNIWVRDANGSPIARPVQFLKLDFIPPAQGFDNSVVQDPSVDKQLGPLTIPLAPGITIVRYFIGLQDNRSNGTQPMTAYVNSYDDRWGTAQDRDNLYVLYRAEVRLTDDQGAVNQRLFDVDAQGRPILNDPNFFYGAKADAWRDVSRVVVELERTDLIQYDQPNNNITPLLSFTPQHAHESAVAAQGQSQGVEVIDVTPMVTSPLDTLGEHLVANETVGVAPTLFVTQHGGWTVDPMITAFRTPPNSNRLKAFRTRFEVDPDSNERRLMLYRYTNSFTNPGVRLFDITGYQKALRAGVTQGSFLNLLKVNDNDRDITPFYVDPKAGRVMTAFPSDVLTPANQPAVFEFNVGRPQALDSAETTQDVDSVNGGFREMVRLFTEVLPSGQARLLLNDIARHCDLSKASYSPLTRFAGATIVPGSEIVEGPDHNPGPHYGLPVRYTRIPNNADGRPGRNQYKINYVAKAVPDQMLQRLDDFVNEFGESNGNVGDLKAAIGKYYLARYNVGYIEFASELFDPIPINGTDENTKVRVSYEFQVNRPNDTFTVDYASGQLITITLGVRRYDTVSTTPQRVIFTSTVKVRNFLR